MDKSLKIAIALFIALCFISLVTSYYGSTDAGEYKTVAKFFAGEYKAKIRASHSLTYSILNSLLIKIFHSYWVMKVTTLLVLLLIVMSMYIISGKDKKTFILFILSPIVWYIAPWISPIPLSALFFLWGFYFLDRYEKNRKKYFLFCSGILIGLSFILWNTVIFMLFFLVICFFFNKKAYELAIFLLAVLIGYSPLLVIDKILYGFPFYTLLKFIFGVLATSMYGGIYGTINFGIKNISNFLIDYLVFLIMLPFFSYTLFNKKNFLKNKKTIIFLSLIFLFFLINPQIRYLLFLYPILIMILSKALTKTQFKIQLIIFLIISLLVINPYIIQIKYSTNFQEFTSLIANFGKWTLNTENRDTLILEDFKKITVDYPNETFIVGNSPDSYDYLASLYWGNQVKEFVSIQDYNLWLKNETILFQKKFMPIPKIKDRRQIWIAGGINKNENDDTDYENITLGIGINEPVDIKSFNLTKKYQVLYLSEKQI